MAVFTDTKCDENDVRRLDPNNGAISFELFTIFTVERERIRNDPNSAPFADQRLRLIALSRDVEAYRSNNQPADARAVMRQIAEEQGTVGGKGGVKPPGKDEAATPAFKKIEVVRTVVDPSPIAAEPAA